MSRRRAGRVLGILLLALVAGTEGDAPRCAPRSKFSCCTQEVCTGKPPAEQAPCCAFLVDPQQPNDEATCAALGELFLNDWDMNPFFPCLAGWIGNYGTVDYGNLGGDYNSELDAYIADYANVTTTTDFFSNGIAKTNAPKWDDGDDKTVPHGWVAAAVGVHTDYCSFYGVACDSLGRVITLSITAYDGSQVVDINAGKGGKGIPRSLGNVTSLQVLDLRAQVNYDGSVPAELGSLTALTYINLEGTSVTGTIPASFGSLTALTYLNLGSGVGGALPAGLAGAASLQYVDPNGNSIQLSYGAYHVSTDLDSLSGLPPTPTALAACCSVSSVLISNTTLGATLVIPNGLNVNITGDVAACGGPCAITMTAPQRHLGVGENSIVRLQGLALLNGFSYSAAPDSLKYFSGGGSVLVTGTSSLIAERCSWLNNSAFQYGGAIAVSTTAPVSITLSNCVFARNSVADNSGGSGDGGAIYIPSALLSVTDSVFTDNSAAGDGGAIAVAGFGYDVGTVLLNDCSLLRNSAGNAGGALSLAGSNVALSGLTCANNSAVDAGGCAMTMTFDASTFALDASELSSNTAAFGGGLAFTCTMASCTTVYTVSNAVLTANSATLQGGGLHMLGGGLNMEDSTFLGNVARSSYAQAGGLFVAEYDEQPIGGVVLTRVNFTANTVELSQSSSAPGTLLPALTGVGYGGAFMLTAATQAAQLVISGGSLTANAARSGAGGYVYGNVTLDVIGTLFTSNTAVNTGGALCVQTAGTASAVLSGATFVGNAAGDAGGAVMLASGVSLAGSNSTFARNAARNGAAFYLAGASSASGLAPPVVALQGGSATGNVATFSGGLFYTDATAPIPAPSCASAACTGNVALNGADKLAGVPLAFNCTAQALLTAKPGAALPAFAVAVFDGQGNAVESAPDLTVTVAANVSATAAGGGLGGATVVLYRQGAALFDALTLAEAPGTAARLTYTLHSPSLTLLDGRSGSVDVLLAACDADEVYDWDPLAQRGSMACLCRRGAFLTGGTCLPCPPGTFTAGPGLAACTLCTPGSYANADGAGCTACLAGTFLNESSQLCQPCAAGSFSPAAGAVACTINPPGFASSTQTTFSSNVTLSGVSSATFGSAQNVTLMASIAATLNVSADAVAVTSVTDVPASGRRRTLQSGLAAVAFSVRTTTQAASLRSSLGATATFSSALSTALRASADPVLSAVTGVTAAAPSEAALVLAAEPCPRGTYLDGLSQQCETCLPGLVTTSTGATACEPCPPNFAWASPSRCVACPPNSQTSPTDAAVCACEAGFYDTLFGANATTPRCAPCPPGGACTTGFLAAAEGYWRPTLRSTDLYACRVGNCLAENITGPLSSVAAGFAPPADGPSDNCAPGNTGPFCAVCLPGYALQSGACAPCAPQDAWRNWSTRSRGGLIVGCVIFAFAFLVLLFLQPLLPALERLTEAASAQFLRAWEQSSEAATRCFHRCCCCFAPAPTMQKSTVNSRKTSMTDDGVTAEANGAAGLEAPAPAGNGTLKADTAGERLTATTNLPITAQASGAIAPSNGASEADSAAPSLTQRFHHRSKRFDVAAVERSLASNAAFAAGNLAAFVAGVDGGVQEEDTAGVETSGVERHTDAMDRIEEFIIQLKGYTKILINFFQIISTFLRSLDVPWPAAFVGAMARVNVINLNLVELPAASCLNPSPSFYDQFQGYTLGLFVALVTSFAVFLLGSHVLAPVSLRERPQAERDERLQRFKSNCLSRVLLLLYLVYPGVSVAILSVFKCTTLESGASYLDADVRIMCYDARHWRYIGGAIVWLFLVPAGIPAFFLWLLRHFRVPQAAALLTDNAWLRECVKMAWLEQMAQPPEATSVTYESITTLHLEALVAFFLHDYSSDQAAEILTGLRQPVLVIEDEDLDALEGAGNSRRSISDSVRSGAVATKELLARGLGRVAGLHRAESKRLVLARKAAGIKSSGDANSEDARVRRSFLLATLLCHCRTSGEFSLPPLTWDPLEASELAVLAAPPAADATPHPSGVRCAELSDVIETARREVSFLFAAYRLQSWYWEVVELIRKLALTSILALIAPGSAGQVVVGLLLAFAMLLATTQLQPYAHPTLNLVAKAAQLNLFLLLLVALLLKLDIDGEGDAHFFGGIVTALCIVPIGMPFLIGMYLRFIGGGLEARSLVRDSSWDG